MGRQKSEDQIFVDCGDFTIHTRAGSYKWQFYCSIRGLPVIRRSTGTSKKELAIMIGRKLYDEALKQPHGILPEVNLEEAFDLWIIHARTNKKS